MKVKLTHELIEQARSSNGGWSLQQLRIFGIYNFKKGWKKEIVNRYYESNDIERFVKLKDVHLGANSRELIYVDAAFLAEHEIDFDLQYRREEWLKLRSIIIKRDKEMCTRCKSFESLQVHHIKYLREGYIWEVEPEYLITLCLSCHESIHDRKFKVD